MDKTFRRVLSIAGLCLMMTPCMNAKAAGPIYRKPANPTTIAPKPKDKAAEKKEKKRPVPVVKNKNTISVPGFGQIDFVAGQKHQNTKLHNPEQNNCYFRITIVLEDGTVVWKSGLMKPGEKAERITLLKALPEGVYNNTVVKYDCFTMTKDRTPLNNAVIKLKLVVKK